MGNLPSGYMDTDVSLAVHTGFNFEGAVEADKGIKFLAGGITHLISFIVAGNTRNRMLWLEKFNIDQKAIKDGDTLLVLGAEVLGGELSKVGTKYWKPTPTVVLYKDYIIRERNLREPADFFRACAQPSRPELRLSPDVKKADLV